jgi:hypothetical protein
MVQVRLPCVVRSIQCDGDNLSSTSKRRHAVLVDRRTASHLLGSLGVVSILPTLAQHRVQRKGIHYDD